MGQQWVGLQFGDMLVNSPGMLNLVRAKANGQGGVIHSLPARISRNNTPVQGCALQP